MVAKSDDDLWAQEAYLLLEKASTIFRTGFQYASIFRKTLCRLCEGDVK